MGSNSGTDIDPNILAERGRRRLSGCNDPPEKQPVENDERRAKMPQEHEERF